MPVCIAGMHRSGTSLMARLLNLSGLYLGPEQAMLPAGPTNPDGHWEHEGIVQVNEELLAEFGGGWDYPPDLAGLDDEPRVARYAEAARAHLAGFAGHDPWGWKDPRNSLTLPFWQRLVGAMTVVVCVRNPLEVALSLRMRNGSTIAFGLALWRAYTEALLRSTAPATRVVTHYQRYHGDPVSEVERVAARIGLAPTGDQIGRVRAVVRPELRHSRFTFADLLEVRASTALCRMYRQLCAEADAGDQGALDQPWAPPDAGSDPTETPGRFDYAVMERLRQR
ncbi:MAG: sulfotransferase family protein [Vicinamibacterales bacterium]